MKHTALLMSIATAGALCFAAPAFSQSTGPVTPSTTSAPTSPPSMTTSSGAATLPSTSTPAENATAPTAGVAARHHHHQALPTSMSEADTTAKLNQQQLNPK